MAERAPDAMQIVFQQESRLRRAGVRRWRGVLLGGGVICAAAGVVVAAPGASLTPPHTGEEIKQLIDDLNAASYQRRTAATRRLCAIGMPAQAALRAAVEADDAETALRARAVLSVLERLFFQGVEIRLAFSKATIGWDEPVELRVTLHNRSAYPARVPFEINGEKESLSADTRMPHGSGEDARQVAIMLDVAEHLTVEHAEGKRIELKVDDIEADPAVASVVYERVTGGPVSEIPPGAQVTLVAPAFNRGWARYPLLDRGPYRVAMAYVPAWEDDVLADQQVGRVVSNTATITVTEPAPERISRSGVEASLSLRRAGDTLAAVLTNHADLPIRVNLNFGSVPPFAEAAWVLAQDGQSREVPIRDARAASWDDFDPLRLVTVAPGERIDLAKLEFGRLGAVLRGAGGGADAAAGGTIHFVYSNICDRHWQMRQDDSLLGNEKAPPIFRKLLPRRILSTRLHSDRVELTDLP